MSGSRGTGGHPGLPVPKNKPYGQELCESRDGRPGLPSLSLMVSVDVKQH